MEASSPTSDPRRIRRTFGAVLAVGIALVTSSPARSASVETFVLAIAGQAQLGPNFQCSTGGPATAALAFFPNTTPGVPIDGLATCHIGGGFRTTTLAGRGPLSDVSGLSNSFGNTPNAFSGSALSLARAGSVLASSDATFSGPFNSLLYEGAASYGVFEDRLTPTSPSVPTGTAGTLRLFFTVDGHLSVTGSSPANSTADVEVNYSVAGGPSFTLLRAQASRPDQAPFAISGIGDPLTGFTLAPGFFGGHGDVRTFPFAFTWGQPFALKVGVLASSIPGPNMNALVDFTGGVTLTGIELQANGQPVTDFTITSESGTPYGPTGVPEPALGGMTIAGVASLAALARRRGRTTAP